MPIVLSALLVVAVVAVLLHRVLTPSELQTLVQKVQPFLAYVDRLLLQVQPFRAALRSRRRWLGVTPVLLALNVLLYVCVTFSGASHDDTLLLAWGAVEATRAASGEWWRLITATFVNPGMWPLLATLVAVAQVAALVERLVGPMTVACAYVAAGALGHAVIMFDHITIVHAGAAAATFGLYGVVFASSLWGFIRGAALVVPLAQYKLLAPGAALVLAWMLATYGFEVAHALAGLAMGFIIGLAGAMRANRARVTLWPVAFAASVALVVIACAAIPVRSVVTVRQELARLLTVEDRIAETYRAVLREFAKTQKRVDPATLTRVIEQSIVPQLARAAEDIARLHGVMPEHQPLVASAMDYLRLREASWRLRAEGLRKSNMRLLQQADSMEQKSMEALRPLQSLRPEPRAPEAAASKLS